MENAILVASIAKNTIALKRAGKTLKTLTEKMETTKNISINEESNTKELISKWLSKHWPSRKLKPQITSRVMGSHHLRVHPQKTSRPEVKEQLR
jgi:hypothetical protein